jgi:hypothetical protein
LNSVVAGPAHASWQADNFTLLGTSTLPSFSLGTWYTLALRANGTQLSVEVNGSTVIGPVTDSAFTSGEAGVWSYAPTSVGSHRFDNFSVTVLGGGVYRKVKVLAMTDARRRAVVSAPPANTTYRLYYYANGQPIAMRELPPGNAAGTLYFLHSDHPSASLRASPWLHQRRHQPQRFSGRAAVV